VHRALACLAAVLVLHAVPTYALAGGVETGSGGDSGAGGGSASDGGSGSVTSWVIGLSGGGVRPPQGAGSCTRWRPATDIDPSAQPTDVGSFKVDPDRVVAILHFRNCDEVHQYVWIRQEPPKVIASVALHDIRTELLAAPEPATSPPGRAIVNLETWLSVTDPGAISATASIPGLAVTVTATMSRTTWTFGHSPGAVTVVCDAVGRRWSVADDDDAAPCGHTFGRASDRNVVHPVEVTVAWDIVWSSTDGVIGDLDPITSDPAVFDLPVHEIQTIGSRG
jgi:hypothetical protein